MGFPEWCEHTAGARCAGDKDLQRQIIENGKEADAHLKRMRDDQESYALNLEELAKSCGQSELKALRASMNSISEQMFGKIQSHILEIAAFLLATHPVAVQRTAAGARIAVHIYLFATRWPDIWWRCDGCQWAAPGM